MSLHIGNLSGCAQRDELERVFYRFGHCNVRLKGEGYGFVVYDFPPDAEKALRALQGRNICGEQLTLTWSKKQPKSFQRFARSGRSYEMQRGRTSDMAGIARKKMNLNGWRNYKVSNDVRNNTVDIPGGEREYHRDDFKDYDVEEKDYRRDFPDDEPGACRNFEDNGRWGESIHDSSMDNENENAIEFDQYEPYHDYDRTHENENRNLGYSGGSPAENSHKNVGRARIDGETSNHPRDPAYVLTCYRCGDSGHKMRDCPKKGSSFRKYNRWDDGQDGEINWKRRSVDDPNKFGSGSRVKLHSGGNTSLTKHQKNESRLSGSRHHQRQENKFSPTVKEIEQSEIYEHEGRKRSGKEIGSPKRSRGKKARRSITSSLHSDHIASRLNSISQSSKSLPRSHTHSRSRSASSSARFSSPNLRSSKSHYSRGRSPNSKRSSTPSSLSVSLAQPLPSASNKIHLNSKGSTLGATAPESLDNLVGQGQQTARNLESGNDKSKDTIAVNGNDALSTIVVDDMGKDQILQEDNNENRALFGMPDKGTNFSKALPDRDTLDAENLSSEMKQTESFRHHGPLVMGNIPVGKSASETHANVASVHSEIISSEEMCMVFKRYGLELPKEDEENLPLDAFFGCARSWPWHIIYYRRLKKGPISVENYARRVAQNQEFGIVDKYVRSSSGWGEFSLGSSQ